MQHIVMISMADDYVELHQLSKALQVNFYFLLFYFLLFKLLNHVANELRKRNFKHLLYQLLIKYLNIAYFMVNINEYVWALIQLINPILYKSTTNLNTEKIVENCIKHFIENLFSKPPTFIPNSTITSISNKDVCFF